MARSSPVLIVLASVVVSVGLSHLLLRGGAMEAPVAAGAPVASSALEARIARLEERAREVPMVPAKTLEPAIPERVPLPDARSETTALAERLALLEGRLTNVEDRVEPSSVEIDREAEREREDAIREAQRTLADPAASVADKVAAHETLRRVPDAYTKAMVADLVSIGTNDPDPRVRADVWCFFDGSSQLPELVPHLLAALETDVDPLVRDEASETLGNYADLQTVVDALRFAAQHDQSQRVRAKAQRTLLQVGGLMPEGR